MAGELGVVPVEFLYPGNVFNETVSRSFIFSSSKSHDNYLGFRQLILKNCWLEQTIKTRKKEKK
jgi:hypothetical protein